jgi:environmental stress-induced protein Ves
MPGDAEVRSGLFAMERETTVVHVADLPSRPWRNGAGRTTTLHTQTSSLHSDPAWTLSRASLVDFATFSTFEGYDRHFIVAERSTVELNVDGRRRAVAYTEVTRFAGEERVRVYLLSGELRVQGTVLTTRGDTVLIGDAPLSIAGSSAVVARILLTRRETGSTLT